MAGDSTTIIFVHLTGPWATFHRRPLLSALAGALPECVRLICVDRPVTLDTALLRNPRRFARGIWHCQAELMQPNMLRLTPRVPMHDLTLHHFRLGSRLNARILGWQLHSAATEFFPSSKRFVHWIYHPVQAWVFGSHDADGAVYECYDEYSLNRAGQVRERLWRAECSLLGKANLTFATSEHIAKRRRMHARRIQILPNGISDSFLMSASNSPAVLEGIPRPRVVCLGNLHDGWDYDLIHQVFSANPNWQLVLIGPRDRSLNPRTLAPLNRLPNVHFLGYQPYDTLPALLSAMDAGLAVLRASATSRALTHLKMNEYLARGLPVISTLAPEDDSASRLIRVATSDPVCLTEMIRGSLASQTQAERDARCAYAAEFAWSKLVERDVIPALSNVFHWGVWK